MCAYRHPAPAPLPLPRFERALPGLFTRVRLSEHRVRIDAPDVMAMLVLLHVLPMLAPAIAHWSWMLAALVCILAIFTTRIHLRVSRGRVWLVRTIASVPWAVHRPTALTINDFEFFDEDDLVAVLSSEGDPLRTVPVVGMSMNGISYDELCEIARACGRLRS